MSRGILFFGSVLLGGCSTLGIGPETNSGQIEYRIAEAAPVTPTLVSGKTDDKPLAPAKLVRRYSGSIDAFNSLETDATKRDVFSITLEQAVIGKFIGEQKFAQPAEVAILANAFEFEDAAASVSSPRFYEFPEISGPRTNGDGSPTSASEGLKLIYFSPDVYLQQPLNFSALPIIPPSKYHGRPIGIQLVVLELDRMSGPLKSLMRELANLGQASNVANVLPGVGSVALELGSSLLNGNTNNDDIVFEYRMVLYPAHLTTSSSQSGLPVNEMATFQPGRYVLRRSENRSEQLNWSDLNLDHNTGRLYRGDNEVRDETYLVLNVIKHPAGTPQAAYAHRSLAQFNEMLEAASATDGSASLQAITDNISARVAQARSRAWHDEADRQWLALQNSLRVYDVARYPGSDTLAAVLDSQQCELVSEDLMRPHLTSARLRVDQAAIAFVDAYKRAKAAKVADAESDSQFSEEDRWALIAQMRLFAVPKKEELEANFASVEAFESNYIDGKNGSELGQSLITAVSNTPRTLTCEQLHSRGWRKN